MARRTEVKKRKGGRKLTSIDLFVGCGGLSEGSIWVDYAPVAHIEIDVVDGCVDLRGGYHGRA